MTASGLVPRHAVVRCVEVDPRSAQGPVRLLAHEVAGPLADLLRVEVAIGTGSAPDCADFSGTGVYAGTLADMAALGGGVDTGWDGASGVRTFRLVAEVADDERALGATVTSTFSWVAAPVAPDAGTPPPSTDAGSSATGTTDGGGPSASQATRVTGDAAVGEPSGAGPRRQGPAAKSPGDGVAGMDVSADRLRALVRDLTRTAWLPLLLLVALLVYLRLQDALDRHDPKLALAPMHPDPLIRFPTTPGS